MKENIGMFGQNNGNPLNKKQTNINDTKNKQEIKTDEIYRKGIYNNDNEKKELEIIDERNLQNLNPTQLYSQFNQNGDLLFEGRYINGIKWIGKIREYHENGKLKFECEYINGEINGKGKEYYDNGDLLFEGLY